MALSKAELFALIAKTLKVSKKKISISSNSDNIENWDSLGQLNILTELDQKLKGKVFSIKGMANALSSKKIVKILESHKLLK